MKASSRFQGLLSHRDPICLTVVVPVSRVGLFRVLGKSRIRRTTELIKHLLVKRGCSPEEMAAIMEKLAGLWPGWHSDRLAKGVGLYVSARVAEVIWFPFEVEEVISVDEQFETSELDSLRQYNASFYVLELSHKDVRVFRGADLTIEEVFDGDFPMLLKDVRWRGQGTRKSAPTYLDLYEQAGRMLLRYVNPDAPMIVCGARDEIAAFRRVTNCEYFIASTYQKRLHHQPGRALCRRFSNEAYLFRRKRFTPSFSRSLA